MTLHPSSDTFYGTDCPAPDPYRHRGQGKVHDSISWQDEEMFGRAHSYLPYTNHPPDIALARNELYVENDEPPAKSLAMHSPSSHHIDTTHHRLSLTDLRRTKKEKHRHTLLFFIAGFALVAAIVVAFLCWPRTPLIRFSSQADHLPGTESDWGSDQAHPYLRATWLVNVTLDNRHNFVPTHVTQLDLVLTDQETRQPFARSSTDRLTLLPGTETLFHMPFTVDYQSPLAKDTTFEHLYTVCGPRKIKAMMPPALNVTLQATFAIAGLAWRSMTQIDSSLPAGFRCPVN